MLFVNPAGRRPDAYPSEARQPIEHPAGIESVTGLHVVGPAGGRPSPAVQAVESAGLKLGVADKGIVVVGSNCMKDGMINIKAGKQFATATQIPTEEAEIAAKKVVQLQVSDRHAASGSAICAPISDLSRFLRNTS